jgi:hypothetical protein
MAQEHQEWNNTIFFFPRTETSSIILILSYVGLYTLKDYSARSQGANFFNRQISLKEWTANFFFPSGQKIVWNTYFIAEDKKTVFTNWLLEKKLSAVCQFPNDVSIVQNLSCSSCPVPASLSGYLVPPWVSCLGWFCPGCTVKIGPVT